MRVPYAFILGLLAGIIGFGPAVGAITVMSLLF
jgi:predicted PurR-regulated permease PerM